MSGTGNHAGHNLYVGELFYGEGKTDFSFLSLLYKVNQELVQ